MKTLRMVIFVLATLIVTIILVGFVLPNRVKVTSRDILNGATVDDVHQLLNNLTEWPTWSPWNENDMEISNFKFSDPAVGIGATWTWESGGGTGSMKIIRSSPEQGIDYEIAVPGFKILVTVHLTQEPNGTRVSWTDQTEVGFGPLGGWMKMLLGKKMVAEIQKNQEKALQGLGRYFGST